MYVIICAKETKSSMSNSGNMEDNIGDIFSLEGRTYLQSYINHR